MIAADQAVSLDINRLRLVAGEVDVTLTIPLSLSSSGFSAGLCPTDLATATVLEAIWGLRPSVDRQIVAKSSTGSTVVRTPVEFAARGMMLVPNVSTDFGGLRVDESLSLGLRMLGSQWSLVDSAMSAVFEALPVLAKLRRESEEALSGGERRQVAVGRAIAFFEARRLLRDGQGGVLVLDDPFEGLHDNTALMVYQALERLYAQGVGIFVFAPAVPAFWLHSRVDLTKQFASRPWVPT